MKSAELWIAYLPLRFTSPCMYLSRRTFFTSFESQISFESQNLTHILSGFCILKVIKGNLR